MGINLINHSQVELADSTTKLTIDGETKSFQVFRIPLDLLYYNDQNDRISTWLSKYFYDTKQDSIENLRDNDVKKYNDLINDFIIKSNPDRYNKTLTNMKLVNQKVPGVVLKDGRIIDGNRRFSCLRALAVDHPKFGYFEAAILDKDIHDNKKQIKLLELVLQHGEETKVDYNPIDKLVGIYQDIVDQKLITIKEYAFSTQEKEKEVERKVAEAKLMVEFLEFINAPKMFHIARDLDIDGPLLEILAILNKISDTKKAEDMKLSLFSMLLVKSSGDITRQIRQVKSIVDSSHLDNFIDEQLIVAKKIHGIIPKINQSTVNDINLIRSRDDLKQDISTPLEKYSLKIKAGKDRNKPKEMLESSINSIKAIDVDIVGILTPEEIVELLEKIDELSNSILKLRTDINAK